MLAQELRFRNGSVWVQAVQIFVFNSITNRHDQGRWLVYFNFSMAAQIIGGETLKDSYGNPIIWNTDTEGIKYANERFRRLF